MNKKSPISHLRSFIQSLSVKEIYIIRKQLVVYSGSRNNLSLKLFNLLKKDILNNLTEANLAEKIYPNDKRGLQTFRMLRTRLKEKIFDFIIHDANIKSTNSVEGVELESIKIRKEIAQLYYLILTRENHPLIQQLLDEIIHTAKKYEFFIILIDVLKFQKHTQIYKSWDSFLEINREILRYENAQKATMRGYDLYCNMLNIQITKAAPNKSTYVALLRKSIKELEHLLSENESSVLNYYLLLIRRNLLAYQENYKLLDHDCKAMIQLLESRPALFRTERVGSIYLFMSKYKIAEKKLEDAEKYALLSKKHFKNNSSNHYSAIETIIYIAFLQKQYLRALELTNKIIKDAVDNYALTKYNLYLFYKINILFKHCNFKEALKLLKEDSKLLEDKSGYNFGIRLLTIMTHLELEQFDEASNGFEALRKHIQLPNVKSVLRKRDICIFQILNKLNMYSYNFKKTASFSKGLLLLLESNKKNYSFEPFMHELFPFNDWFNSKLLR